MPPLLDALLRAGPRGYVLVWASGGLLAALLSLAGAAEADDEPAPAAAPRSLLRRLLLAPWAAPARLLQRAARGFPQPFSSPLFLVPAGVLALSVLLQPLGAPARQAWRGAPLRRAAATLAGLHCLSLSHCEVAAALAARGGGRGKPASEGGAGLAGLALPLAAGLGGLALLCAGTAPPVAALLPAASPAGALLAAADAAAAAAAAAAADASASPWLADWASQLVGSSSQTLKDHAIKGLNEAEKYSKTVEVGLGLAGLPFPLTAAVEGTKSMLGVPKSEASAHPAPLTEAQLASVARAVTWGELEARAPSAAGALGGALAALVVGALALLRGAQR